MLRGIPCPLRSKESEKVLRTIRTRHPYSVSKPRFHILLDSEAIDTLDHNSSSSEPTFGSDKNRVRIKLNNGDRLCGRRRWDGGPGVASFSGGVLSQGMGAPNRTAFGEGEVVGLGVVLGRF